MKIKLEFVVLFGFKQPGATKLESRAIYFLVSKSLYEIGTIPFPNV